ncbi:MAG: hypothetical protein ACOCSE_00810 [Chitinivibrionales bacterium]
MSGTKAEKEIRGDTSYYRVIFRDRQEAERFRKDLNELIHEYEILRSEHKGSERVFVIRAVHGDTVPEALEFEGAVLSDSLIETEAIEESAYQPDISYGGKARVYSELNYMSPVVQDLMVSGVGCNDSAALFSLSEKNGRSVVLKIMDSTGSGDRKGLTSLDVIDIWSKRMSLDPAWGRAVFKGLEGLQEFIAGEENTVRGFTALDPASIKLRFRETADEFLSRVTPESLILPQMGVGAYILQERFQEDSIKESLDLYPGEGSECRGYLDSLGLIFRENGNPLASFSTGRYEVLLLSSPRDIQYVENSNPQNSTVRDLVSERYFLRLNIEGAEDRDAVAGMIDPGDIISGPMVNVCAPVDMVFRDTPADESPEADDQIVDAPEKNGIEGELEILYLKGDRISEKVSGRIASGLEDRGAEIRLTGKGYWEFSRALFRDEFDIVVGFISEPRLDTGKEAGMELLYWFGSSASVKEIRTENRIIPLFTARRIMVHKQGFGFAGSGITGIFSDAGVDDTE